MEKPKPTLFNETKVSSTTNLNFSDGFYGLRLVQTVDHTPRICLQYEEINTTIDITDDHVLKEVVLTLIRRFRVT